MAARDVMGYRDPVRDVQALAGRLRDIEAVVLIRERPPVTRELLELVPGSGYGLIGAGGRCLGQAFDQINAFAAASRSRS